MKDWQIKSSPALIAAAANVIRLMLPNTVAK
jgi:hypothetical protein